MKVLMGMAILYTIGLQYYSDIEEDAVNEEEYKIKANLLKMLKGFQSFDSICTELNKSRTEVEQLIESFGAVNIVNS